MRGVLWRAGFWSALYFLLALLPLLVSMWGESATGRGVLLEFGVGLGIAGYAMLVLQFATTTRFRWVAPRFGTDAKIQFHRETGILAVAFVLAHPALLFLADRRFLDYLNPWANLPRAVSLSGAVVALVLLIVLPLWRLAFRMSYEWWRLTHGLLAFVVIVVGLVHALQVEFYVFGMAKQAFWVLFGVAAVALLFHTRVVSPLRTQGKPYRVVEVRQETARVWNLALEPEGHPGMRFRAGQYAWLTMGKTPFTLQQHPFSFASADTSAARIEFAIKELGDFTSTIKDFPPGTPAFLEGPYGAFTLDPRAEGAVFIAGGIGISPALSMLRTCRDRRDRRPLLLLYANGTWEKAAFREELDELRGQLNLEVVHVLEEPPAGWQGESGFITAPMLARYVEPRKHKDLQYFVCGPVPMMDAVEQALLAQGIPQWRVEAERFDLV